MDATIKFTKITLDGKPFQKKKLEKDMSLQNLRLSLGINKDVDFADEGFPIAQVDESTTTFTEILNDNAICLITNKKDKIREILSSKDLKEVKEIKETPEVKPSM